MTSEAIRRLPPMDPVTLSESCPAPNCALCAALGTGTHEALNTMTARIRRVPVEAGESIGAAIEGPNGLTVLAQGMAMAQKILSDGRRQVLSFMVPGDLVNLAADADPRLQTVALKPGRLCRLDSRDLDAVCRRHPAAAPILARLMMAEIARATDHMLTLGRLAATEKVAMFLLDFAARAGTPDADGNIGFPLPMHRDDIADYLGLNVETVSRQLSRLRREGVIALPKRDRVVINDLAALRERAPFQPVPAMKIREVLAAKLSGAA